MVGVLCKFAIVLLIIHKIGAESDGSCNGNRETDDNDSKTTSTLSAGHCGVNDVDVIDLEMAFEDMALIPGGYYTIGTDEPQVRGDMEGPARRVYVSTFFIDKYEVSNADFQKFIDDTNYQTDAEHFGDSFVFGHFLTREERYHYKDVRAVNAEWWYKIPGADWRHPEGGISNINDRMSHPVVHVSWHDAVSYCKWKTNGGRLPTEAEWETACRGGKKNKLYPWGNKLMPNGKHMTNIWQGAFPEFNDVHDGYAGTCPVDEFDANYYGLHNMVGNVWEWTDTLWYYNHTADDMVKKGGSFLCHKSHCFRYRCAARSSNTRDSSASNLGFRCALSTDQI